MTRVDLMALVALVLMLENPGKRIRLASAAPGRRRPADRRGFHFDFVEIDGVRR